LEIIPLIAPPSLSGGSKMMRGSLRRQFKICLVGEGFVGKTSIRRKYLGIGFKRNYIPTLGVDFAQKTISHNGIPTNLIIWDIAGQSQFETLRKRYYDGASGIMLVYSTIDRASFENASKWLVEAHAYVGSLPPIIIAGNKIDLRLKHDPQASVSTEMGREFAEKMREQLETPTIFIETSALTGENIDAAFEKLTELMLEWVQMKKSGKEKQETTEIPEAEAAPETSERPVTHAAPTTTTHETAETPVATETRSTETQEQPRVYAEARFEATQPEPPTEIEKEIDPYTGLREDSEFLEEDEIGEEMTKLVNLRTDLKKLEDELANITSDMESELLVLKNTIHVKRIMYDHLKKQLQDTRDEWAEAYDNYMRVDEQKKAEVERRSKEIEHIRRNIEQIGKTIRSRVSELEFKKMSQ
jgi:small GTP-binding protein